MNISRMWLRRLDTQSRLPKTIYEVLVRKNLILQAIVRVSSDGTDKNVGSVNDAIQHLEMLLGLALHDFICQIYGIYPVHTLFSINMMVCQVVLSVGVLPWESRSRRICLR